MFEMLAQLPHYLLSFIVVLSVIVFVHEFGHYLAARLCGVRVEMFSIGFGKELFGWNDTHGTRWKFSLLPFGGYVKMYGDASAASTPDSKQITDMTEAQKRVSFHHKNIRQKAIIVAAGPVANFLLTIAIFTYFIFSTGLVSSAPVVGGVLKDSAAAEAGLQKGDKILRVNAEEIESFNDISQTILLNLGTPVTLDILRQETPLTITLTPRITEDKDALGNTIKRPLIGIRSQKLTLEEVGFFSALGHATAQTYDVVVMSMRVLGQMISGDRSVEELKGPLGIAKMSGEVTQHGDTWHETMHTVLWFIALLSVNLGFVNLLPIPMLDGGHLAFYAIEGLRGRPMAEKYQEYGYRFGFACILTLMAFTIFNDIRHMFF